MYFSYQNDVLTPQKAQDPVLRFCFLLLFSGCPGDKEDCGSLGTSQLI